MTPPSAIDMQSLQQKMMSALPFEPVSGQKCLLGRLAEFVASAPQRGIFLLNGHAGTGKTSLLAAFVKGLCECGVNCDLLAPTGRAAKVFSNFSGRKAFTIHKRLYRADSSNPGRRKFFIAPNRSPDTVFIVDEASMIGDNELPSHSLLQVLLSYVFSAPGCLLILVGDKSQLPPVGQLTSPAMNVERLRSLGFEPWSFMLNETVRQTAQSGILYNANLVLKQLLYPGKYRFFLNCTPFSDIEAISPRDLEDYLTSSWSKAGTNETLIITRSNRRANIINSEVRARILYADTVLQRGEQVLITKNNYFWTRNSKSLEFIANGETAVVEWMGRLHVAYGFLFADAELSFPGKEEPVAAKLMLSSLEADGPGMSTEVMDAFYNKLLCETEGEFAQRMRYADSNEFFNALQIKYSYCVTCHKAQGGQWKHVYIDMGSIPPDAMNEDFWRWLYTAITRATEKVFLVNPSVPLR